MDKARRFTKSNDSEKSFIDMRNPKCLECHAELRMVTRPIKLKCDTCGLVYTINPYTGAIATKFRSFVRSQDDKTLGGQ
jgi:hypothetical protein